MCSLKKPVGETKQIKTESTPTKVDSESSEDDNTPLWNLVILKKDGNGED
jgi:hypothetical protein